MNLTAQPDEPVEISFQVVDSLMPLVLAGRPGGAVLSEAFGTGSRILDLGSGAGFPGLVLAAACAAHFTLCESRRKRVSFLRVAIAELDLKNVTVESAHVSPKSFPRSSMALRSVRSAAFRKPTGSQPRLCTAMESRSCTQRPVSRFRRAPRLPPDLWIASGSAIKSTVVIDRPVVHWSLGVRLKSDFTLKNLNLSLHFLVLDQGALIF